MWGLKLHPPETAGRRALSCDAIGQIDQALLEFAAENGVDAERFGRARGLLERERLDPGFGEVVADLVLPDGLHPLHVEGRELHFVTTLRLPRTVGSRRPRYARRVRRIGHRGAMGHAPENTLASFQRAIELECDEVETDVWVSPDGRLLVSHDRPGRHTVLTLDEVLDFCRGRVAVNVELKCEAAGPGARGAPLSWPGRRMMSPGMRGAGMAS